MRLRIINEAKELPKRKMGNTGMKVSLFSLGGQGSLEEQGDIKNNIAIIRKAFDLGVNYMDTSPIYNKSEDYYGEALDGIRDKIFLASKSDKRNRDGALKDLEKSFKRLKTDYLDVWQIHHIDNENEINEITGKGGALEAFIEMKEQGVVKNIGITSHAHPDLLLEMMNRYDFDTVLCPVNAADRHMKKSFVDTVVKKANSKNIGIIGMKVFAQGYIFDKKGIMTKWEPIIYSLNMPISTIIVGIKNIEQLEENIAIAKSYRELSKKEIKAIEAKTKNYKRKAQFFRREFGGYDSKEELGDPIIN
jgi:aryl-alcohol dehydrogenase-like predicted oxidoreductase